MTHIVLDVETTGIPRYAKRRCKARFADPRDIEAYRYSRIVSIAWLILDPVTHRPIHSRYFVIRPYDFWVHPASTAIHGISHEDARQQGYSLKYTVLPKLFRDIETFQVHTMVAHNIEFDKSIILSELYRLKVRARDVLLVKRLKEVCTMKCGQKRLGMARYPSLTCLYEALTGDARQESEAHNALHDANACAVIFTKLTTF